MDMVSLNIVGGILVSICRDMGVTVWRCQTANLLRQAIFAHP